MDDSERVVLTGALYRAYWVDGLDISAIGVLKRVVKGCDGLSKETREKLLGLMESGDFEGPEQRRELEESTTQALKRGAFGVPAFYILEEGRLYWGQDRLHFLEKALFKLERKEVELENLMPRCIPVHKRAIPQGEEVKMEFWYDFSSPWAFLGWTQLARLQRIFGPGLRVHMKPFLLGILFREYALPIYLSPLPL